MADRTDAARVIVLWWARWAVACLLLAVVILTVGGTTGAVDFGVVTVVAALLAAAGVIAAGRALRLAGRSLWWLALAPVALVVVAVGSFGLTGLLLVAVACALVPVGIVWANAAAGVARPSPPGRRRAAVAVMVAAVLTVAALGVLEVQIWMPLAITDDAYDLGEIYAAVGEESVSRSLAIVAIWAGVGVVLAAALAVLFLSRVPPFARARASSILLTGCLLVGLGTVGLFWAGFALGNDVSDTVAPMVGGWSSVGLALSAGGVLALLATIVLGVAPLGQPRPGGRTTG